MQTRPNRLPVDERAVATLGGRRMKDHIYREGEVIFREGEPSDAVLQIVSGEVEVFRDLGPETVTLGRVGPGEFLGEMGVLLDAPHAASARALGTVEAVRFEREQFLSRLGGDRESSAALIVRLCQRLRIANHRLTRLGETDRVSGGTPTPGSRVAVSASAAARAKGEAVDSAPTVTLLAGSTRLAREMGEWSKWSNMLPEMTRDLFLY